LPSLSNADDDDGDCGGGVFVGGDDGDKLPVRLIDYGRRNSCGNSCVLKNGLLKQ
jgi:hypothetical protein